MVVVTTLVIVGRHDGLRFPNGLDTTPPPSRVVAFVTTIEKLSLSKLRLYVSVVHYNGLHVTEMKKR